MSEENIELNNLLESSKKIIEDANKLIEDNNRYLLRNKNEEELINIIIEMDKGKKLLELI